MENKKFWVYYTNSNSHTGFQNVNLEFFSGLRYRTWTFSSLRHGTQKSFGFTELKLEFFQYIGWNPEIFPVHRIKTWIFPEHSKISKHGSVNFWFPFRKPDKILGYVTQTRKILVSISSGNFPEFYFTEQISRSFHFQNGISSQNNKTLRRTHNIEKIMKYISLVINISMKWSLICMKCFPWSFIISYQVFAQYFCFYCIDLMLKHSLSFFPLLFLNTNFN